MSTSLPETVVTATRLPPTTSVPRGPPRLSHKRIDVTFTLLRARYHCDNDLQPDDSFRLQRES
jgi:hypothetical protein